MPNINYSNIRLIDDDIHYKITTPKKVKLSQVDAASYYTDDTGKAEKVSLTVNKQIIGYVPVKWCTAVPGERETEKHCFMGVFKNAQGEIEDLVSLTTYEDKNAVIEDVPAIKIPVELLKDNPNLEN